MRCAPKVSIIIVNYNGTDDTIECIESLLKIHYANFNIVIVDNGSKDCSKLREYINTVKSAHMIETGVNAGFSAGNNVGINYASDHGADYLLLLNNDTVVRHDFLDKLVEAAQEHPQAGIICGKIFYFSNKDVIWYAGGDILFEKGIILHTGYNERNLQNDISRSVSFATGCMMLISAETIKKVGLLSEDYFMYGEDADYCCRTINQGYEIWYEPQAVIYHKVGASSKKTQKGFSQYYSTRNDFYLFSRYAPLEIKKKSIRKLLVRKSKECIKGILSFRWLYRGFMDYRKGITGKVAFQP